MDHNSPSRYWAYVLLLAGFFGLLFAMGIIFPHHEPTKRIKKRSIGHQQKEPKEQESIQSHKTSKLETDSLKEIPIESTTSEDNDDFFEDLKTKYQTEVINRLVPGKPRTDIIIRYYQHPPDGDKVYALRDLGFYIHERPVEQDLTSYESNSIYYGDSVKREDLMIVAYTLLNQGMPIKNIAKSIFHDGWKATAIEIGTDTSAIDQEVLTIDEIRNLSL